MRLTASPLNLTLRHRFTISRNSTDVAQNVLAEIKFDRHVGRGEASPARYYGQTQASSIAALKRMAKRIETRNPFELEAILTDLQTEFPKEPSAIAAIDVAIVGDDDQVVALRQP